jgi:hypothetical protein
MKLIETAPPDRGSIALTYSCPECGYEFAMLTNPYETEVVGSLGVEIGSESSAQAAADGSKCPFSGMVQSMTGEGETAGQGFPWTPQAVERLESIPAFVRPMAKSGIEKFARENGYERVDDEVLDEARHFFGM